MNIIKPHQIKFGVEVGLNVPGTLADRDIDAVAGVIETALRALPAEKVSTLHLGAMRHANGSSFPDTQAAVEELLGIAERACARIAKRWNNPSALSAAISSL